MRHVCIIYHSAPPWPSGLIKRWNQTLVPVVRARFEPRCGRPHLRSSYTMRTKCAISDAFVRDCVFAYCASVAQYVYSLSAEHYFRLRNSAISDERVRDCALSTHSVFRPFAPTRSGVRVCGRNRTEAREREWAEGTVSHLPGTLNVGIKFCHSTGIARSGGGVRASTTSYA